MCMLSRTMDAGVDGEGSHFEVVRVLVAEW